MDTSAPEPSPGPRWRARLILVAAAVIVSVCAAVAGRYLTLLIESPLIAPTRENPPLFVFVIGVMWLVPTAFAIGAGEWAGHLARLSKRIRRRWRWIYVGVVLTVWVVVMLLYVNDPLTVIRWHQHG